MNINLIKNALLLTPAISIGLGCLVKTMHGRGVLDDQPVHDLGRLAPINDYYESCRCKAASLKGFVITLLSIEILPMLVAAIEEMGKQFFSPNGTLGNGLLQGGVFLVKATGYSLAHTIPILGFGLATITVVKEAHNKYHRYFHKIDPSGHAINVCWNAALRCHTLDVIRNLGFCSYTYVAFAATMSVIEGIWIYDTTVNHHSIMDMITGCALSILSIKTYDVYSLVIVSAFNKMS